MNTFNHIIKKPLTPPKAFFKWCTSQIPTYQWQNQKETILASSRKNCPLIKKRLTKNSRLTFPMKFYCFAIILSTKKRIEIQTHCYWQTITDGKETLDYERGNLERFANDSHIKAHYADGNWYQGLLSNYGYMSGAYTNAVFYPNDWQTTLERQSELKYVTLPPIDRYQVAECYKYRREIEYLQKIGATKIANDIIYRTCNKYGQKAVDMRFLTWKWLKASKAELKKGDCTFNQLMLKQVLAERNSKPIAGIEKRLDYRDVALLPKKIKGMKFQKWWLKQTVDVRYYLDYLKLLEELNVPLKSEQMIFPNDLQIAHDKAVATLNQLKREVEEKNYLKRKQELKHFEKEIGEYVFLAPNSLQEIVQEGNALHHCVGGKHYLENHSQGKTTILFIRQKDHKDQPYFTLEYRNQRIVQIQGKYNREEVPEAVTQAVEKWQKVLKQTA